MMIMNNDKEGVKMPLNEEKMKEIYCETCGKEGKKSIMRFGKYFCSETHAEDYVKERRQVQQTSPTSSGCC